MTVREIQILKKLNTIYETQNFKDKIPVPKVLAEGNLILYNFDQVLPKGQYDSVKLCKYYLMPMYEMNLKHYMSHFKSPKERYFRIFEIIR